MGKIKKMYFYYGAILNTILQHNPDASPTLILNDEDSRQAYRILTNTSKQECVLFFKYSSCKQQNSTARYNSWIFSFSTDDKEKLQQYYNKEQLPVFICLLCLRNNIQKSEIAILKYEEYLQVLDNQTITIGLESGKHNFYLFLSASKSRKDAYLIPTTRIYRKFDDLTQEIIKSSNKNFRKTSLSERKLDMYDLVIGKIKHYPDSTTCPLCNDNLESIDIYNEETSLKAKKCLNCGKIYLCKEYYRKICTVLKTERLRNDILIMDYIPFVENKSHIIHPQNNNTYEDTIFIIENENSFCPIHSSKMKIKIINWGKGKKDTVFYCSQCDKMMIDIKHKNNFETMMNSHKTFKKYQFKNLEAN